jgi:hypothetical protein
MDRHGPKHLTVAAGVVSAAGFLSFLLAERPWQIAGASFWCSPASTPTTRRSAR